MIGYIYIMSNSCFAGLLKIGLSRDPERRRKSLSNASVPTPYTLVCTYYVRDMVKAENEVFDRLKRFRHSKEFFNCDPFTASRICSEVQEEINLEAMEPITEEKIDMLTNKWDTTYDCVLDDIDINET